MKDKTIKEKLFTKIEEAMKKKVENASQEEISEANAWIEGYECCKEEFSKKLEQLKKEVVNINFNIINELPLSYPPDIEMPIQKVERIISLLDLITKKIEELK